jgi:hypothetical protein
MFTRTDTPLTQVAAAMAKAVIAAARPVSLSTCQKVAKPLLQPQSMNPV